MISVAELDDLLSEVVLPVQDETVGIDSAVGRVLSEEIVADRDIPPFDRVCMDGFALRWDEWSTGRREFALSGSSPAGAPRHPAPGPGSCVEVTTGAPAPIGCDLVVRIEDSQAQGDDVVFRSEHVLRGQNLHWRGSEARAGATILAPGTRIGPAELGVLASVGAHRLRVRTLPRIAVCSTGDELVEVQETPLPHQIRRSNDRFVASTLERHGFAVDRLFPIRDESARVHEALEKALERHDVVIVSGGVSASARDLVPETLLALGVRCIAHGVAQKPGKPFWTGIGPQGQFVAALPGNPMAAAVCFRRYALPVLLRNAGLPPSRRTVRLSAPVERQGKLVRYVACKVREVEACLVAEVVSGNGSGDYLHLAGTDGFLQIEPGTTAMVAGALAEFLPW